MSGIGSVGGQGPIYPEYVGAPQTQWDGKPSGDFKKDIQTAKNVMGNLIYLIDHGGLIKSDGEILSKLTSFLVEIRNQKGNTLSHEMYTNLNTVCMMVDGARDYFNRYNDSPNYVNFAVKNSMEEALSVIVLINIK